MVMAFGDHLQKEGAAAAEEMPLEGRCHHVFFNYWGVNLLPQTNAQRNGGLLYPQSLPTGFFWKLKKSKKSTKVHSCHTQLCEPLNQSEKVYTIQV
jgi:hypothetical protein